MLPTCSPPTPIVCCAGPLAAIPAAPADVVAAPRSSGHRSKFSEAPPGALARVGKQDPDDDPVAAMERYAQMAAEKESRWAHLLFVHQGRCQEGGRTILSALQRRQAGGMNGVQVSKSWGLMLQVAPAGWVLGSCQVRSRRVMSMSNSTQCFSLRKLPCALPKGLLAGLSPMRCGERALLSGSRESQPPCLVSMESKAQAVLLRTLDRLEAPRQDWCCAAPTALLLHNLELLLWAVP